MKVLFVLMSLMVATGSFAAELSSDHGESICSDMQVVKGESTAETTVVDSSAIVD